MDRTQKNDVLATATGGGVATTACPTAMMPLSTDWTALSMQPNQNTNVTIGLVWAWQSLTPNLQWTEALAAKPDLDKVIILLPDGDNTQNRFSTTQSQIDARTTAACDNVRVANIKLYTIRVIDGNASLLKSCATRPRCTSRCRRLLGSVRCLPRSRKISPTCASPSSRSSKPIT